MPKTLEEFIWVLFIVVAAGLGWLIKYCYRKHDYRITELEKRKVLTDEECKDCITRTLTKAVKTEFDKFVVEVKEETKVIRERQEELRGSILPERYVKKEDLKEDIKDLKDRFMAVEEDLQFLIEQGFRDGQKKKANR